jgi:urea transport system substrate-binding protein
MDRKNPASGERRAVDRRTALKIAGLAGMTGIAGCSGGGGGGGGGDGGEDPLTFGALYALSGAQEVIGRPMMNSTELAVQQINNNGGVNGRQIELVKADNGSQPNTGIEESRRLVNQEGCDIVFGAYTSAMRNAITSVYVENEVPLFYPTLYEGGVCTQIEDAEGFGGEINIPKERLEWLFVNGAVPEQQIEPYIPYLMENYDVSSFYLIGSDYVWPHTTNAVLDGFVEDNGGEIVAENYVPLGFTDWGSQLNDIQSADPDIVYHTVVGSSMVAMYRQAADLGLTDDIVWASNVTSEQEARAAGQAADGTLVSAPYFTSVETEANETYRSDYDETYGTETTPNFVAEGAYWGVHMTAKAIAENDPEASSGPEIKAALENPITYDAPQGEVSMDPGTHHCAQQMRVGEFNADSGDFEILEDFGLREPYGITVQEGCLNE